MKKDGSAGETAGWTRRVRGHLLGQRLRAVWITAGLMLLIFMGFRIALLAANWHRIEGVGPRSVARCLAVGVLFDGMPIGYFVLPIALAVSLVPEGVFARRWFRRTVAIYAGAVLSLVVAIEFIGAPFFMRFGRRLNWMALDYLRNPGELLGYLWSEHRLGLLLLVPTMVAVVYGCYRLFLLLFWRGPRPRWRLGFGLAQAAVLAGLCVLACRGSLGHRPRNESSAFFSTNKLVNQLTMNNWFTYYDAAVSSLTDGRGEKRLYDFPKAEAAAAAASRMLCQAADTDLGWRENPLWRRTTVSLMPKDYNVVVVIMEGMSGPGVGALGYYPSSTPELDAICRDGLFFERMYAVGARTSRAMVSVLCGHPDLGGKSILTRKRAQGNFLTLPEIFRRRGYHTVFLYGGDPDFDEMRSFFAGRGGISEVIGQKDMPCSERLMTDWGAHDEVILHRAHERFLELGDRRFFAVILTVSDHPPYRVPSGRVPMAATDTEASRARNAHRYADWALGQFFREAREADYFRRTVFVLVADHGRDLDLDDRQMLDVPHWRVPCVIYAPHARDVAPAARVHTVASQADIPPTILAALGGSFDHCFLGRNLLQVREDDGFAFLHEGKCLGFVRGRRALVLPPRRPPFLFELGTFSLSRLPPGPQTDRQIKALQHEMLSYYMMAERLYRNGVFRRPGADDAVSRLVAARGQPAAGEP